MKRILLGEEMGNAYERAGLEPRNLHNNPALEMSIHLSWNGYLLVPFHGQKDEYK